MSRRVSALGNGLVALGAVVGVATVGAIGMGYQIDLTPAMTHLLVFKGLGAAAAGLIFAGSWIARGGRRNLPDTPPADSGQRGLNEAQPDLSPKNDSLEATMTGRDSSAAHNT